MANERLWDSIGPIAFTANGGQDGVVTLISTSGLRVKQQVKIYSAAKQPLADKLEIKKILTPTKAIVGKIVSTGEFMNRVNLSDYLLADSASLTVIADQERKSPRPEDILKAIYEQEPVVAIRTFGVDEFGNPWTNENPLPTTATISGDVTIGTDGYNQTSPDSMNVTGSENGAENGIKHSLRVDSDLDLRVGISNGNNKAGVNISGELSVIDSAARTSLQNILNALLSGTLSVSDANAHALLTTVIAGLVSIDAGIPASLGQQTQAASMPVTIASDQTPIPISGEITAVLEDEPIRVSGTENGQPNGTESTFVNNLRLQILAAKDRDQEIAYADFGNKNQRVTQIDYTAPSIGTGPGFTARKTLTYTLVGNLYRRDNITWSIV